LLFTGFAVDTGRYTQQNVWIQQFGIHKKYSRAVNMMMELEEVKMTKGVQ
jgi:hypothetical protein